jgi:site-specific DNA-methyltransferase (adenine-specific)
LPKTFNPIKDRRNIYGGKTLHGTIRQKDGSTKKGSSNGKTLGEYGIRYNVWNIESEHNNETNHPAVFPRRLVEDHIKTWSNEGDLILDCFMGSGTTRFVCYDLNRNFIGYEISKEYFDDEERRYIAYTSQMKLL